ncbi:MAG: hypothetical protein DYG94_06910 [Leptolyngbya sp. PLA3]|nr:MAG: hypothetical protein EDM82_06255 [Cyanobacteria bacterium CYA]MCE7968458.1 hypothetical protein [Leptolyngbya sp. PL-A3]
MNGGRRGSFALKVHLKGASADEVKSLVARSVLRWSKPDEDGARAASITPKRHGWITIFPSDELFPSDCLNGALERDARGPIIAFGLHDSDVLSYRYLQDGEYPDYYNS